ncbi:MAG: SDR family NAD(P)-dependent oxidoreductase [Candidatus Rifleibacteriota bacterium]
MNNRSFSANCAFVTGAGGFIGSHLTEALLSHGVKVKALVHYNSRADSGWLRSCEHPNLEIHFGDVRDQNQMNRLIADCDTVFHLAALIGIPYSYEAAQSYVDTNVTGTLNILLAAALNRVNRIILTSTSEVYGTAIEVPMSEKHPLQAQSPYAASKISADMLGLSFARSFSMPVTIVRPFNTFGPRQSMRAVIPTIAVQALKSDVVRLGNLTPIRDFNYVEDTVSGFIAAAASGRPGAVYNLSTGNGISIEETAKKIIGICGNRARLENQSERARPQDSEVERLIGDSSFARRELGWSPRSSFDQGLAHTIDWVKENLDQFPEVEGYVR